MSRTFFRTTGHSLALALFTGALLCLPGMGLAQEAPPAPAAEAEMPYDAVEAEKKANFQYQTGTIVLGEKLATLDLGPDHRYLPPAEATRLLVDYWGNPPGAETL